MVLCKSCKNEIFYSGKVCPICKSELSFDKEEIISLTKRLDTAIKNREYELILEGYHILADLGFKDAQIEYAKILEKGEITAKNPDLAMKYYGLAARRCDAFSAYKYSELLIRESIDKARFWLIFSAVLGSPSAYPKVAEELENSGYEADASYFYSLGAACDDVFSIATMAKRYYNGIGVEKNESYAKWYMDKLKIPPIYAIKLAYKLRKVKADEPQMLSPKNYNGFLHRLAIEAERLKEWEAYTKLCEILFEKGDVEAGARLGETLINSANCKQDFAKGMDLLKNAASRGSARAHNLLADTYLASGLADYTALAISHYESAGALGDKEAYKRVADMYCEGKLVEQDYGKAVAYYELAAKLGNTAALERADGIKSEREELYRSALQKAESDKTDAFRLFAISTAMGHPSATYKLAEAYELGCGVAINRHGAYLWYKKAYELGINEALLKLGKCYANGFGVKLNYKLAREYISKAERLGLSGARETMQSLMQRKIEKLSSRLYSTAMHLIYQKKFKLSKTFLELSADLLNPKAIYTLGCLYEFGVGAGYDKTKAFSLYREASALGFFDMASSYKLRILKMLKTR